ncbi:MAG: hypothetical protein ACRCVA_26910 [Phreatobacter sp.]
MAMTELDAAVPSIVLRHLRDGEQVVWWGRPMRGLLLRWNCNGMLFFFLLFLLVLVGLPFAKAPAHPIGILVLELIQAAIVVFMLVMWLKGYLPSTRSVYVLTDQRALILMNASSMSFPLETIEFIDTKGYSDGQGHVLFYYGTSTLAAGSDDFKLAFFKFGFLALPDCEEIARLMLALREKSRVAALASLGLEPLAMIPSPARAPLPDAIAKRLDKDEPVMWWAHPEPRHLMARNIGWQVVQGFYVLFLALCMASIAAISDLRLAPLVIFPLGYGLWRVLAPWRNYASAPRITYALTDRRALIVDGMFSSLSFPFEAIAFIETKSATDDAGHVLFYEDAPEFRSRIAIIISPTVKFGFLGIDSYRKVARQMQYLCEQRNITAPAPGPAAPSTHDA